MRYLFGFEISSVKTKSMDFRRFSPVRNKLTLNDRLIERVRSFRLLACGLSYIREVNVDTQNRKV